MDQAVPDDEAWQLDGARFGDDAVWAKAVAFRAYEREINVYADDEEDGEEDEDEEEEYYDADEEQYDGEYDGNVVYWDEEKGFVFITDQGGDRTFFHVSGLSVKEDQDYLRSYNDVTSFDPNVRFSYEWQESRQEYKAVDVHWLSY